MDFLFTACLWLSVLPMTAMPESVHKQTSRDLTCDKLLVKEHKWQALTVSSQLTVFGPSTEADALTNCDTSTRFMLRISVRPLTHRCAYWSQGGACSHWSHGHCSWCAHRHGSHCHTSLTNLCTDERHSSQNLLFWRGKKIVIYHLIIVF